MGSWGSRALFFVLGVTASLVVRPPSGRFISRLPSFERNPRHPGTTSAGEQPSESWPVRQGSAVESPPDTLPEAFWGSPVDHRSLQGLPPGFTGSQIVEIAPYFQRLSHVCVEGRTGNVFLLQSPGEKSSKTTPVVFRADSGENTPDAFRWNPASALPPGDGVLYYPNTTLWVNLHFGKLEHFGHWILFCAYPFIAGAGEYLSRAERRDLIHTVMDVRTPNAHALPFTAAVDVGGGKPVSRYIPEKTSCFAKGLYGMPSWEVFSARKEAVGLFDAQGHRAFGAIRVMLKRYLLGQLGAASGGPGLALPLPEVSPGRRRVLLTIRASKSGFGRNITNSGEIAQRFAADPDFASRAELHIIGWLRYSKLDQLRIAETADVMMGVHGNNLIWQVMMKPQGVLVELYPFQQTLALKGVNVAASEQFRSDFMNYIGLRMNLTSIVWVSSTEANSPLASKAEYKRKPFSHRCRRKSSRRWMCRHLNLPYRVFSNLLSMALTSIGNFTGVPKMGPHPWEQDEISQKGRLSE